jgi:asparagine synthase (glutamine-hydrolysing)
MSGICGVLMLDGRPVDAQTIGAMLGAMKPRGPDRSGVHADGGLGLGHVLLATTPEALCEPMPWRHAATGCVISADARLDNRDALIDALGIDGQGRVIGDGEVIVAAYLKWGLDCPTRLLGDLAFALWDPRHRRLLCVRDKVGMRRLLYHHAPGRLLAFATDMAALLRHPEVPQRLNEVRIGDFLEDLEEVDFTSTFYRDVQRLPRAHALVVENGTVRCWRYWQLEPGEIVTRPSDEAYDEAFRDVFSQAVRARLRSARPVGSMISGGIDSGAVTGIAARLLHSAGAPPLKTFSAIAPEPDCPESNAIRAAWSMPHLEPHRVSLEEPDRFAQEVAAMSWDSAEPFDTHMVLIRAVYSEARRQGVNVVLDGVAGDNCLPDDNLVSYYLSKGRPLAAWRAARADEWFWSGNEGSAVELFTKAARKALVPDPLRQAWRAVRPRHNADPFAARSPVAPGFAARTGMAARRHAARDAMNDPRDCSPTSHARQMLHPYLVVARERYDRVASQFGIEPRDPYMDPRVMQFCLTLPVEQFKQNGWPKFLLRRSMADIVPDAVRWRRGRDHIGWRYIELCLGLGQTEPSKDLIALLAPYIDEDHLRRRIECCGADSNLAMVQNLSYLRAWLSNSTQICA